MNAEQRAYTSQANYTHTNIDRTGHQRTVAMRVLSLSWPRCATMSTSVALFRLGFNDVYHMQSVFENPPDAKLWERAIAAKFEGQPEGEFVKADWDALLGHCEAVTDWPASAFPEELIGAYPDAKVILFERQTEKWWKSCRATIWQSNFVLRPSLLAQFLFWNFPPLGRLLHMARRLGLGVMYPSPSSVYSSLYPESQVGRGFDSLPAKYEAHIAKVKLLVPPEKLLLWDPADGWAPLCEFLGVDIPDGEVPFINDAPQYNEQVDAIRRKVLRITLRRLFAVGVSCAALFIVKRRFFPAINE